MSITKSFHCAEHIKYIKYLTEKIYDNNVMSGNNDVVILNLFQLSSIDDTNSSKHCSK